MTPLLELDGLGISLPVQGRRQPIVRSLSLSVEAGEAVALVGESGAGKSMTGRAIARLLPPGAEVSGTLEFDGRPVMEMGERQLREYRAAGIGLIFQDPRAAINPVRRIGDFLTEALTDNLGAGRAVAVKRVSGLLGEVGISDPERRLRQYPDELSGGMLQRVMIASVLAMRPKLVIADEPTTALDATTQSEVMAILKEMQERLGLAMLLITHDLDLAAAVCSRTAVMYAGTVVETQPSASLHLDPLHPYTAALVTSRPGFGAGTGRLPVIPGRPLSAYEVPEGCVCTTRCSHAEAACSATRPALEPFAGGQVACIRAAELRHRVWPVPDEVAATDA